jgi:hypothetical protein
MVIRKYGRYRAVLDTDGTLVCLCMYKCGAMEVVRRLSNRSRMPLVPATTGARGNFFAYPPF